MICFVSQPSRITLVELSLINTSYQKLPFGSRFIVLGFRPPRLVQRRRARRHQEVARGRDQARPCGHVGVPGCHRRRGERYAIYTG